TLSTPTTPPGRQRPIPTVLIFPERITFVAPTVHGQTLRPENLPKRWYRLARRWTPSTPTTPSGRQHQIPAVLIFPERPMSASPARSPALLQHRRHPPRLAVRA